MESSRTLEPCGLSLATWRSIQANKRTGNDFASKSLEVDGGEESGFGEGGMTGSLLVRIANGFSLMRKIAKRQKRGTVCRIWNAYSPGWKGRSHSQHQTLQVA